MPRVNRSTLMTVLPIAAAVLLMGVSCYYQGMWSERWGEFPELKIFTEQLKEVPMNVGEWQGKDEAATDARILKIAGAAGARGSATCFITRPIGVIRRPGSRCRANRNTRCSRPAARRPNFSPRPS
jgi:hypothetical protein